MVTGKYIRKLRKIKIKIIIFKENSSARVLVISLIKDFCFTILYNQTAFAMSEIDMISSHELYGKK